MFGVDLLDQMLSYYPVVSRTLKWHKKLFFYLLQMCLNNACVVYNEKREKKEKVSMIDFQLEIVQSLCFPFPEENDDEVVKIVGEQVVSPAPKNDLRSRLSGGFMDHKRWFSYLPRTRTIPRGLVMFANVGDVGSIPGSTVWDVVFLYAISSVLR